MNDQLKDIKIQFKRFQTISPRRIAWLIAEVGKLRDDASDSLQTIAMGDDVVRLLQMRLDNPTGEVERAVDNKYKAYAEMRRARNEVTELKAQMKDSWGLRQEFDERGTTIKNFETKLAKAEEHVDDWIRHQQSCPEYNMIVDEDPQQKIPYIVCEKCDCIVENHRGLGVFHSC